MEISFMRALEVKSGTNPYFSKSSKVDPATMAVINTMRGDNSSVYDRETSRKIGDFLKSQLNDYNKKTGIFTRRIDDKIYLFTGDEAEKARKISADAKQEMDALEEKYLKGPDENSKPSEIVALQSEEYHKICRQNIGISKNKKLLDMVENGRRDYIPSAQLNFEMDENGKVKKIVYKYFGTKDENFKCKENTLSI